MHVIIKQFQATYTCILLEIYDLLSVTQKAKGSAEARKRTSEALKAFFSDPKNRQKRSIAMKGQLLSSTF